MFDALQERLGSVFSKLTDRGALKESDVAEALREVRVALLEADVALPVVKDFIAQVQEKAVGEDVLRSVTPDSDFPARCAEFAQRLRALVARDPDIAIYLSMRQDEKRLHLYGLTHTLHVALVVQLMAARLGWPEARIASLVQAALEDHVHMLNQQAADAQQSNLTQLQRRIAKLKRKLEETEDMLERARASGVEPEGIHGEPVDPGVKRGDPDFGMKKELLGEIFRLNVELRQMLNKN